MLTDSARHSSRNRSHYFNRTLLFLCLILLSSLQRRTFLAGENAAAGDNAVRFIPRRRGSPSFDLSKRKQARFVRVSCRNVSRGFPEPLGRKRNSNSGTGGRGRPPPPPPLGNLYVGPAALTGRRAPSPSFFSRNCHPPRPHGHRHG